VLDAVISEIVFYENLAKDVPGFTAAEIVAESPAYFTGLVRRLGVYLKKVEARGGPVPIPTNNTGGDEYFKFADILNATAAERSAAAAACEARAMAKLQTLSAQTGLSPGWLLRTFPAFKGGDNLAISEPDAG